MTNDGESSVDSDRASSTAWSMTTASGTSSRQSSSKVPSRRIARSTAGIRSSDQPWEYVVSSSSIRSRWATTPSTSSTVNSPTGGSAGGHPPGQGLEGVRAALLGLEEHVERALAGLAPGGHQQAVMNR